MFGESFIFTIFVPLFIAIEICILSGIYVEAKLFIMAKGMKRIIKNARIIGKPIFFIFAYLLMIIEFVPNLIAIIICGIISFFQYLANSNMTYKNCFMSHFEN